MRYLRVAALLLLSLCSRALAADLEMTRVLVCEGDDARMEVYLPQALVSGSGLDNVLLKKPVVGAYTLDLTDAGKGKSLELVRVSIAAAARRSSLISTLAAYRRRRSQSRAAPSISTTGLVRTPSAAPSTSKKRGI